MKTLFIIIILFFFSCKKETSCEMLTDAKNALEHQAIHNLNTVNDSATLYQMQYVIGKKQDSIAMLMAKYCK